MPAPPIALADAGKVYRGRHRSPGIRSYRYFHSKAALAEAHAINRFWMQVVRHELVVSLKLMVGDIEKNCPILGFNAVLQNFDGFFMALKQRRQQLGDERLRDDLRKRFAGKQRNESR